MRKKKSGKRSSPFHVTLPCPLRVFPPLNSAIFTLNFVHPCCLPKQPPRHHPAQPFLFFFTLLQLPWLIQSLVKLLPFCARCHSHHHHHPTSPQSPAIHVRHQLSSPTTNGSSITDSSRNSCDSDNRGCWLCFFTSPEEPDPPPSLPSSLSFLVPLLPLLLLPVSPVSPASRSKLSHHHHPASPPSPAISVRHQLPAPTVNGNNITDSSRSSCGSDSRDCWLWNLTGAVPESLGGDL